MPEIFRERAGTLCIEGGKLLLVRLRDPASGRTYLFPPGGAVEKDESPEQAALRETLEETGYRVELVPEKSFSLRYPFTWDNKTYSCLTHFFLARLREHRRTQGDCESLWVPLSEVSASLAFHPQLQTAIVEFIDENSRT